MTISIEQMKALCDQATDGPWGAHIEYKPYPDRIMAKGEYIAEVMDGNSSSNCKFMSASRTFVPEAIRVLEMMAEALRLSKCRIKYLGAVNADRRHYEAVFIPEMDDALAAFDALAQGMMKGDGV